MLKLLVLFSALLAISPAALAQNSCGNYIVIGNNCELVSHFGWFAVGGGWQTTITLVNPSTTDLVSYNVVFVPTDPSSNACSAVYVSTYGRTPALANGIAVSLTPGQSVDITAPYPGSCQDGSPLPNQGLSGSVLVKAGTMNNTSNPPNPDVLDSQKGGQLVYTYTAPGATAPAFQVAVPLVRDSDATPIWSGTFAETPPSGKGSPTANSTALAVLNLASASQSVLVTVADSMNRTITSAQLVLPANGSSGFMLADFFGSAMFPACVMDPSTGICAKLISPDGLIRGNLRIQGLGGAVVPVQLQAIGGEAFTMSSRPLWQTAQ